MRENRGRIIHAGQDGGGMKCWTCWVVQFSEARSLWCLSPLVKHLSGAINFEYRIRPDWQAIRLLPASGVTGREAACDFLPAETTEKTLHLHVSADAIVGKNCSQNGNDETHQKKWKQNPQQEEFWACSSMHSDTVSGATSASWAPLPCALSVREGWWTVLIEGLQIQKQSCFFSR